MAEYRLPDGTPYEVVVRGDEHGWTARAVRKAFNLMYDDLFIVAVLDPHESPQAAAEALYAKLQEVAA